MITTHSFSKSLLFAASFFCATSAYAATNDAVACTMEAKMCPDGVTYVGRQGPNCEFEACPSSFFDVPSNHPNADAINYVKAEGIVEGYADGSLKPEQKINRAEFVKVVMLYKFGQQHVDMCGKGQIYSDVGPYDWFEPHVCSAKDAHLISGYPDGSFKPANSINFVEAAKIIAYADNSNTGELQNSVPSIPGEPWYAATVRYLADRNVIPTSITRFDQQITRGEMAEMIYRLKAGVTDKASKTYEELAETFDAMVSIKLYFGDLPVIIDSDCRATKPVERMIPKTSAVADAALRLLFQGVTSAEEAQGLTSSFDNENGYFGPSVDSLLTYYRGISIENGMATVKFTGGAMAYLNNTACTQETVKTPIERTLLQFPAITSVQYSVDGEIITGWDA